MDLRPVLVVVAVGTGVLLQPRIGDGNAERRRNDFRYTPRSDVMKVVAGAHESTVANMIWLRALPDMSRQFDDSVLKRRWLDGVLAVVTDLEPSFITAYDYGAAYLSLQSRQLDGREAAVALLEKGVRRNPRSVKLMVSLAMMHFDIYRNSKKDEATKAAHRAECRRYLERAVELPDCDDITVSMLAAMQVEDRDDLVALAHWQIVLASENEGVRFHAERNLEVVKKKMVIRAKQDFEKRHGRPPSTLDDLREEGLIHPGVVDDVLSTAAMAPDGTLSFPRLDELELEYTIHHVVPGWIEIFRRDFGRAPTLDEVLAQWMNLGIQKPPEGKRWALERGEFKLVERP